MRVGTLKSYNNVKMVNAQLDIRFIENRRDRRSNFGAIYSLKIRKREIQYWNFDNKTCHARKTPFE